MYGSNYNMSILILASVSMDRRDSKTPLFTCSNSWRMLLSEGLMIPIVVGMEQPSRSSEHLRIRVENYGENFLDPSCLVFKENSLI